MLRKIMIVLAMALAFGGTMPATTAFARGGGGGGGGHMGGGGGGHMGGGMAAATWVAGFGGGGHFGGGALRPRPLRRRTFPAGFDPAYRFRARVSRLWRLWLLPYDDYAYGNCYQTQRYHTRTGWHTRVVYACD